MDKNLKYILEELFAGATLSRVTAKTNMIDIATNQVHENQVAAFLTVFNVREITSEEFRGFRDAMLELALKVDLSPNRVMDLCGTGGDGKNTFNISTLSSLVAAGAGVKVAKHGNRSVSSNCGSSNVLEYMGVNFTNDTKQLKKQIEEVGICFLHAPLFHPAMKNLAPIRKSIGVKTFINLLGPLVNPAQPQAQLTGVFSLEAARKYYNLWKEEDMDFAVVHDLGGYDEISLTNEVKLFNMEGEHTISPADFGFETIQPEALYGGEDVASSAEIFMKILDVNGREAQNNVVCANAGLAISTYKGIPLKDGVEEAKASLMERKAQNVLNQIVEWTY